MRETVFTMVATSMDEARSLLERVFAQPLQAHDSSYRGGAYFLLRSSDPEEVILQRNWDAMDQCVLEHVAGECDFLIYLSSSNPEWVARIESSLPAGIITRLRDRRSDQV